MTVACATARVVTGGDVTDDGTVCDVRIACTPPTVYCLHTFRCCGRSAREES